MARALMAALENAAKVELVSDLRLYDGKGDTGVQARLQQRAETEAKRLIAKAADWQAWITYHNYYKAPDIIGPLVSRALNIPYIQIESTRSPRRQKGPWARFAGLCEAASDHADLIFYVTQRDRVALQQHKPAQQILTRLHPFLPRINLPAPAPLNSKTILTVAMLRHGDKMASYEIIAKALPLLTSPDWQLNIAGDGPAYPEIKALFAPFGARVRFLGQLEQSGLNAAYHSASAFFWPGVNEAFGMVYLEAQAAGVPVVAQDRSGVRDVVHPDGLTPQDQGPAALAGSLDTVLQSADLRQSRGQDSRRFIAENHLLNAASDTLLNGINRIILNRS